MGDSLKEKKATILIVGVVFGLVLIIILISTLLGINSKSDPSAKNFTEYSDVDVTEKKLSNPTDYSAIKEQLESDYLFTKFASIAKYNYQSINTSDLKNMLYGFIFSYSMDNQDTFKKSFPKLGVYCLTVSDTEAAFKELYSININDNIHVEMSFKNDDGTITKIDEDHIIIDFMLQYKDIIYKSGDYYCFAFEKVANMYDNDYKIAIKDISTDSSNIVKADVYVYDYYTSDVGEELTLVAKLKKYIKDSEITKANNIVINDLNGRVTHKELQFKINNSGNFFKYQLLYSNSLD